LAKILNRFQQCLRRLEAETEPSHLQAHRIFRCTEFEEIALVTTGATK